jgi:hypothetical protein
MKRGIIILIILIIDTNEIIPMIEEINLMIEKPALIVVDLVIDKFRFPIILNNLFV